MWNLAKLHVLLVLIAAATIAIGCEQLGDMDDQADEEGHARLLDSGETLYEAENATGKSGCGLATSHAGFTGSGFMDFGGNGTWIEWNNIVVPLAGEHELTFRYANGSGGHRQVALILNGQQELSVPFSPTGSWTNWREATLKMDLEKGDNTIRVQANTGNGGPNLDHLKVAGGGGTMDSGRCVLVSENQTASLSCSRGEEIVSIDFASYGLPTGSCDPFTGLVSTGFSINNTCHAANFESKVEASCLGRSSCTVSARNSVFGDPCPGKVKKLAMVYSCGTSGGGNDQCPDDPTKTEPGQCGCGVADSDSDGDKTPDCLDKCPEDPSKTEPGKCGCGVPEGSCENSNVTGRREPRARRVAVVLVGYNKLNIVGSNQPSAEYRNPRQYTAADVQSVFGQAKEVFAKQSNGIDTLAKVVVYGPYTYAFDVEYNENGKPKSDNCNQLKNGAMGNDLNAQIAKDGFVAEDYDHIATIYPLTLDCIGRTASGSVGSPDSTKIQGSQYDGSALKCKSVVHELGHNMGMLHTGMTECFPNIYNAKRTGCYTIPYSQWHPMGNGDCNTEFSAAQKQRMGWLGYCEDVTAGGNAVFNLSPLNGNCGIRSLRIPIEGEAGNFYYLEYRTQPLGDLAGAFPQLRVLLSVANDGASASKVQPYMLAPNATYLLGSNLIENPMPFTLDHWLLVGKDYPLPGDVTIRVQSVGDVAVVQVRMKDTGGAECRDGSEPLIGQGGRIGKCL